MGHKNDLNLKADPRLGGWLVPADFEESSEDARPQCTRLKCSHCGREVVDFPRQLLRTRPDDDEWLRLYDEGALGELMKDARGPLANIRSYICGCRAFPCLAPRRLDELATDHDLPWYCAGAEIL